MSRDMVGMVLGDGSVVLIGKDVWAVVDLHGILRRVTTDEILSSTDGTHRDDIAVRYANAGGQYLRRMDWYDIMTARWSEGRAAVVVAIRDAGLDQIWDTRLREMVRMTDRQVVNRITKIHTLDMADQRCW